MNPRKIDSAIVGIGLMAFGVFYLLKSGLIGFILPAWVENSVGWIIPLIFLLRAVGEFRYVGFFKRFKSTTFGKMDTKFLSPLCLLISTTGLLVQLIT